MDDSNQQLMLWALLAQNVNVEIGHKKGRYNFVSSALSRAP